MLLRDTLVLTFVENTCRETILSKIIQLWLLIFGAANTFLMDNGGEFANDEMGELGNQYGININIQQHISHGRMD